MTIDLNLAPRRFHYSPEELKLCRRLEREFNAEPAPRIVLDFNEAPLKVGPEADEPVLTRGESDDPPNRAHQKPLDSEPVGDLDTRKIAVTFFPDEYASSKTSADMTLPQLAAAIGFRTAASKMALPWLKLAIFGSQRSDKNCLRTNENVLQISGIEGDHDTGKLSFDEAVAIIRKANIRALFYTSASYVPGTKERWRVLVPLSRNREPEVREKFVARINGLLNGHLAAESFTLSLSYLYGHLPGTHFRVEVVDGDFLDLRDDTYAGSIFKDGYKVGGQSEPGGIDLNEAGPQQRSRANDDPEPVEVSKIEAALARRQCRL